MSHPRPDRSLTRLFVYGSLKRGYERAFALDHQRLLGEATTMPQYRIFDCGEYPGLVEAEQGVSIHGELWGVDSECLRHLDEIEGVAFRLYERREICLLEPYAHDQVQAYFYLRSTVGLTDCGNCWPASIER
jgi:gamma-glutamylaminecyclotransferase